MYEGVDEAVVKRAQAGDEGALTMLYEHYKPDVYRFLYYRTGDRHTAEDLTAEVFIRVLNNLAHYRQNLQSLALSNNAQSDDRSLP